MVCEICGKNVATLKVVQIKNHVKQEIGICKACAESRGLTSPMASLPTPFCDVVSGLYAKEKVTAATANQSETTCPGCGLKFGDFQKTGLLGCGRCYESFSAEVKLLLRQIHGSDKHIGDRPVSKRLVVQSADVEKLRRDLQRAIDLEQFEKAAQLRDLLRDVERQP